MFEEIIKNERLFEKNLTRSPGFECMNQAHGLDSKGIIFIMEHRLIVMAPIHRTNEKVQKLYIYKIHTEIIKNNVKKSPYKNKYCSKNSFSFKPSFKNNTSLVELEDKEINNEIVNTKPNLKNPIEQLNEIKSNIVYIYYLF